VLRDPKNEHSLIPKIFIEDIHYLKDAGIISGGMIPKVECCETAINQSVKKAVIIDGRVPHSLLIEILSEEGIGTMFEKKEG